MLEHQTSGSTATAFACRGRYTWSRCKSCSKRLGGRSSGVAPYTLKEMLRMCCSPSSQSSPEQYCANPGGGGGGGGGGNPTGSYGCVVKTCNEYTHHPAAPCRHLMRNRCHSHPSSLSSPQLQSLSLASRSSTRHMHHQCGNVTSDEDSTPFDAWVMGAYGTAAPTVGPSSSEWTSFCSSDESHSGVRAYPVLGGMTSAT